MYIGLHVQYRYSCQILMKLEFSREVFERYSNIKFHENPSSGGRAVPSDRRTDTTKLTFAFRNFGNAPKNAPDPGCLPLPNSLTEILENFLTNF